MGKLTTYLIMTSGLMLVFYVMGINSTGATGALLNFVLNPEILSTGGIWTTIIAAFTGLATVGIFVGLIATGNGGIVMNIAFYTFISAALWDITKIYSTLQAQGEGGQILAFFIIAPIVILLALTIFEAVNNRD